MQAIDSDFLNLFNKNKNTRYMKTLKSLFYLLTVLLFITSCSRDFDAPPFTPPHSNLKANITIEELKELYKGTVQGTPVLIETDYILKAYVSAHDGSGNIFKQLYFQDATGGINMGIDANGLSSMYKIGQEVFIKLHGLSMVSYGGELQIGYLGTTANRIPSDKYESYIELNNFPNEKNVEPKVVTIKELTDKDVNTLVRINKVTFPDGGKLQYTNGTATTNRTLKDANNNTIDVRTSNYSTFANDTLPEGTGDIIGILGRYNGGWQFLLRSTADVINFTEGGGSTDPDPDPEEGVVFEESFGTADVTAKPKIAEYTGYDNASPIVYEGTGDIRKTTAFDNHIWMAVGEAAFTVKGINTAGKTNLALSYDLTFNIYADGEAANINTVKVYYNGTQVTVPSVVLDKAGGYGNKLYTVTLDISGLEMKANSTLEFKSSSADNLLGIRLDNIKIATKK